jgi:hypothetical protein
MSPVSVTFIRTLSASGKLYHTVFSVAGFLAAAAAVFSFNLQSAEGGGLLLSAVWAESTAMVLPVLAAFVCMDVWSEERRTGTVDALLTCAVRERDFVLGKFFGGWFITLASAVIFWFTSMMSLKWFAAGDLRCGLFDFLSAMFVLALQSALWCAVSVASSAMFRHAAAAAVFSLSLTVVLPRGGWAAIKAWVPGGRMTLGEMPLDAHALDIASGTVSVAAVLSYLILTLLALFIASECVKALRFVGKGASRCKWSTALTVMLSSLTAVLALMLAIRLGLSVHIPRTAGETRFSQRTGHILAESEGNIGITVFMPRSNPRFREISQFLRTFSRESEVLGGARMSVRFVDSRLDFGEAELLVRKGIEENSVVFEKGQRTVTLKLKDGFNERICAAALRRLAVPSQRRTVYWTSGHGECRFDAYDQWGMSDIARELTHEGYNNKEIDLSDSRGVPADCALIVVAGANRDFSRVESGRLNSYLKQGGRMLVLLNSHDAGGVTRMLPTWGINPMLRAPGTVRTLTGTDVIVTHFADHAVTEGLNGTQVILERPVVFKPSAAANSVSEAENNAFTPIASVGGSAVAAVVERGAAAGADLGLRPTRIIVVGDATFAMNAQLAKRANANRDFFLNCVAYLSGTEVAQSGGDENVLATGIDRKGRRRYLYVGVIIVPAIVFSLFSMSVMFRRRRG